MTSKSLLAEPCCPRCTHGPDRPCLHLVKCLLEGPCCHDDPACRQSRQNRAVQVRREQITQPVFAVGAGTCGLGAGAAKTRATIQEWCRARNLPHEVVETGCIGFCAAEPIVDVILPGRPRISFGSVTTERVAPLLDGLFAGTPDTAAVLGDYPRQGLTPWEGITPLSEHPFFAAQRRLVLRNCGIIDPSSMDEYFVCGGYQALAKILSTMTPEQVIAAVDISGLRGRGGGGFPTGKKWRLARTTPASQKYVVCNADEGDPGAFMDRAVVEGDPHRLIEGLAIAAYAIGATKAYVYIRAEYPLAIKRLEAAIAQAAELGLIGYNILDSGFNLSIVIKQGAGAFVCGEETALIHSIEGKRGMPRLRPPYPAASGLFGKPTVINNVETLANIPTILLETPERFAALGTANSKGTKVFALSGKVERTGLVEIEMGTSIRDIVVRIGGGVPDGRQLKAVQIGGPSGGCIPTSHMDTAVDYESLKQVGAIMGSGGLVVMDDTNCMVDVAKFFMEFIQRESCGKCIPCREGTRRMLEILRTLTRPRGAEAGAEALDRFKGILQLEELAQVIRDTSLCGLGQTAPNPVLSTLRWFGDEYEAHIYERRCPAGTCTELMRYTIDPEKCTGCTRCAKACPASAIAGAPKKPHAVATARCIGCGTCIDVCRFAAVTRN
jgi:NADH:ubiquinone oxidoreductase subunit F (NADH-binding)/Pyruvate/2-oxoacid:ferredoxin oxidoreductase delta subunit